ncbi:hypothetical protein HQ585_02670 [candidate division KSB1 bacterium]|nr:hypothetical protein [candidate division KSB1 bacterium]
MRALTSKFQIRHHGLLAGFRLLLWWGAESLRTWTSLPDVKKEIRSHKSLNHWPIASWHLIKRKSYCMVYLDEVPEIRIVELSKVQLN